MNVFEDAGYFCVDNLPAGDDPLARASCSSTRARRSSAPASSPTCAAATTSRSSPRCSTSCDAERRRPPRAVPRGRRGHAADALQGDPPAPSAGAQRQRRRRHPARAGAARADPRARRHRHRHDRAERRRRCGARSRRRCSRPASRASSRSRSRSFGHKHGPARDADLVFDVRFLPNPHWEPELRPLTGFDRADRRLRRARRAAEGVLRPRAAAARVPAAAVRRRGQGAPRGRDRLHRRPPPLGRRSPRTSPRTSATTAATSSRSSTATWTAPPCGLE